MRGGWEDLPIFIIYDLPNEGYDALADIPATSLPSHALQGQSWCIGADSDAQTVAAFLRFYTPDIVGGSLGHHIVEVCGIISVTKFLLRSNIENDISASIIILIDL